MDAVSMFVTDSGEETPELKASSMHQADARNSALYEFGLLGVPVLPGIGKSLGMLDEKELKAIDLYSKPSSDIQAFREKMSEETGVPAICRSPFVELMIPRIEEDGTLRTVGLLNSRIDRQGPIRLHLFLSALWGQKCRMVRTEKEAHQTEDSSGYRGTLFGSSLDRCLECRVPEILTDS